MKTYRVHVRVMPRAGLLDPAGQAVEHALTALGFPGATNVHLGKAIALDQRSRRHRPRARDVRAAAGQSRHRRLHRGGRDLMLRVGVVTFPGSNCESETLRAIARVGADPVELWHQDTGLKGV